MRREELRRHLWGDSALEWETGLYQVIRQLRRVLGDDPRRSRFVTTIPRRGYRWCARTLAIDDARPGSRPPAPSRARGAAPAPKRIPLWNGTGLFLAGAASLVLAILLVCLLAALVP